MNNQKLIMEGWRGFLKKFTGGKEIDLKNDLAMWRNLSGKSFRIVLYVPSKFEGGKPVISDEHPPDVVGMVVMGLLTSQEDPCIPATWQIKFVATAKKYQRRGIGTLLYDIAATYAKISTKGGITSDHDAMTSNSAKKRWDKIDSSSNYKKRETSKGSDTFDYNDETPDPDDDCKLPYSSKNTVDHSYEIVNDVKGKIDTYIKNHNSLMKFSTMKNFDHTISELSSDVFESSFFQGTLPL
jgi:GNAT superfamily N-acetyltransferase